MGGKIGNPQIRGKVAARSLPPSMLGVRSLVLPPSKLEVMSRGRSVAAVHGVKSQLSIEGGGVSKPPQWILSHFSFPDFSSHLWTPNFDRNATMAVQTQKKVVQKSVPPIRPVHPCIT